MGRFGGRLREAAASYTAGSLGFGLFLTWFYCCFNTTILIPAGVWGGLLEACWGLTMLVAGAFALGWLRAHACGPALTAGASCVGTLLVYGALAGPAEGALLAALACGGAALLGVGIAAGIVSWMAVLGRGDGWQVEVHVLLSFLVCFVLYQVLCFFDSGVVKVCLFSLLPLASAWALRLLDADGASGAAHAASDAGRGSGPGRGPVVPAGDAGAPDGLRPAGEDRAIPVRSGWSAVILVASLCCATVVVRLAVLGGEDMLHDGYFQLLSLVTVVLSIVLLALTIQFARAFSLETMARWALPIVVVACAFLALGGTWGHRLASAANGVAVFVIHLFFWTIAAKGSAFFGAQGRSFLCWGVVAICAGKALGVALGGALLAGADEAVLPAVLLFGLATLVAIVMATARGAGTLLQEGREGGARGEGAAGRHPASLQDVVLVQAHALAARYGLSKREEEVLGLLLAGYNRPSMRDKLSISINTINTYCRRIFAKLDVHSQQEAVELAHRMSDGPDAGR